MNENAEPKISSGSLLINTSATKKCLLNIAHATRAQKFTRVSRETILTLNAKFENLCRQHVHAMPSKGKTL